MIAELVQNARFVYQFPCNSRFRLYSAPKSKLLKFTRSSFTTTRIPCIIPSSTKHNCHCRDALLSSWSGPSLFFQGVLVALASHGFLWRTLLLLRCATSLAARIMRRWIVHFWPCRSSPCSISFLLTAHYELSLVNTPLHNLLRFLLIRIWRFEIRLPCLAASFFLFTPFFFLPFF